MIGDDLLSHAHTDPTGLLLDLDPDYDGAGLHGSSLDRQDIEPPGQGRAQIRRDRAVSRGTERDH